MDKELETYRNLLATSGVNPYTADWRPFLDFVVNRRNSVTRIRYGDDPTIALVRVDANTVEYWTADEPRAVTLFKTVGAMVMGGTPNVPESKTIGL